MYPELDNPIVMANLRYSADTESEDAHDSFTSLTRGVRRKKVQGLGEDVLAEETGGKVHCGTFLVLAAFGGQGMHWLFLVELSVFKSEAVQTHVVQSLF